MGSLPVSRMAAQATWRRHFYRTIRREYAKSGSAHLGRGLRIGSARVFLGENGFLRENGSRMFFFPFLLLFFLSFLSLLFFLNSTLTSAKTYCFYFSWYNKSKILARANGKTSKKHRAGWKEQREREREGEVGFLVSGSYGPLKINKFKPTDLEPSLDAEWGNSLQLQLTSQIKSSFESEIFISISFPLFSSFSFLSLSLFLVIFYPFFPYFVCIRENGRVTSTRGA